MGDAGIHPKGADQLGHAVDVNLSVCTRVGFERRAGGVTFWSRLRAHHWTLVAQGFSAGCKLLI
ncbi:MAG: hypothetical protein JST11_15635 [Acidobacteria bacterium]|nr:hypothetical protein [Acidobacteriota bacterium]